MKFCYFDESGMGSEPVLVMVGVLVDAQRMHKTKLEWDNFLTKLSKACGRTIAEFHARDFYSGNSPWRAMDGSERANVIDAVFSWVQDRRHTFTFTAIDKERFILERPRNDILLTCETPWRTAAMHSILTLQKVSQRLEKTKGHTVLIFDREQNEEQKLVELVLNPPGWTDYFYGREKRQVALSHIVDVPYFADSIPILLLQVADLAAFVLRRFSEVTDYGQPERYAGEGSKLREWATKIASLSLPRSTRWPAVGRDRSADLFYGLAPVSLRALDRRRGD